jgi:hypothetical protein
MSTFILALLTVFVKTVVYLFQGAPKQKSAPLFANAPLRVRLMSG